jgi:hypothetical protein
MISIAFGFDKGRLRTMSGTPCSKRQSANARRAFPTTPENIIGQREGAMRVACITRVPHLDCTSPSRFTTHAPSTSVVQLVFWSLTKKRNGNHDAKHFPGQTVPWRPVPANSSGIFNGITHRTCGIILTGWWSIIPLRL